MRQGWSAVTLGDLITPAPIRKAGEQDLPLLSMTRESGLIDQVARFKKRIASQDLSTYKVVSHGQLVVSFPINEGVIGFQTLYPAGLVSPAYKIWDLRSEAIADRSFLQRLLRSPRAIHYYTTKERGSTARRRSMPPDVLLAMPIALPPLDEQRRIAAVLDHVENLRASRQNSLALWKSLLASRFAEIVRSGFPEVTLGDVTHAVVSGRNIVASDGQLEHARFRVLPVGAVTFGRFRSTGLKPIPADYTPPAAHLVHKGDLLFGRANTQELVGAVAIVDSVPEGALLPDKIWRIEERSDRADRVFLRHAMASASFRQHVRRRASGTSSSMKNISKPKLLEIPLPLPPMIVQREFAAEVARMDTLRAAAEHHLADLEALCTSLESRAFAGELDVSKVPLPS